MEDRIDYMRTRCPAYHVSLTIREVSEDLLGHWGGEVSRRFLILKEAARKRRAQVNAAAYRRGMETARTKPDPSALDGWDDILGDEPGGAWLGSLWRDMLEVIPQTGGILQDLLGMYNCSEADAAGLEELYACFFGYQDGIAQFGGEDPVLTEWMMEHVLPDRDYDLPWWPAATHGKAFS